MIGPLVNASAIICGSLLGTLFGNKISNSMKERMPMVFGLASMGIGLSMAIKVKLLPAVVLSLILGAIIGELIHLEENIKRVANILKSLITRFVSPPNSSMEQNAYMDRFISILILFCVSGTGIFGSMNEGMTGDPSLLIVKSFLDFFTAAIFAITLGLPVATLAIPQTLVQVILYFSANAIMPLTTPTMIADFSAVGGLLVFATGFRICGSINFPLANLLPSLIIAMPISATWLEFAA
ncbi:DUF554 domain-containing protein [Vibrio nitrifigilis]|uniref:DUF554 domain-containing protein n=1 Tax=Vibrio nitrifigilis TaxID=2789781 RepID=A0ABS0GLM0_9VIBR|nr:DUF554 domain-containing protein [Vibrio nitrifigilis]MBF9003053.1 DUF554 domain-containing protein [Vibrio nitrifigilis]